MKRYFIFALICGLFVAASVVSGGQKGAENHHQLFCQSKSLSLHRFWMVFKFNIPLPYKTKVHYRLIF